MKQRVWISILLSLTAYGDELQRPKPESFAYGMQIQTSGGGAVFRLTVPEDVYRKVAHQDLRDLRVFNQSGEVVPSSLRYRSFEERSQVSHPNLSFFPIEGSPSSGTDGGAVEVTQNPSGRVLSVKFSGAQGAPSSGPRAYLLDLSDHRDQRLKRLEFSWSSSDSNHVVSVAIQTSDDLKSWLPVLNDAALANLSYQGERLEQKGLEFPAIQSRYLKIVCTGDPGFKLEGLKADFDSGTRVEAQRLWSGIAGHPMAGAVATATAAGQEFSYDSHAAFPVDQVRIPLPASNLFWKVSLLSSSHPAGPWTFRANGTVYRVQVDGKEMASSPLLLGQVVSDRYWQLRVESKEAGTGSTVPALELGWVPHQLTFMASGSAPFRLAYGSAQMGFGDSGFDSLMERLKADRGGREVIPEQVTVSGQSQRLGGENVLESPAPPVPWKKWVLWAALASAVIVVAGMAWKLYRELGAKTT